MLSVFIDFRDPPSTSWSIILPQALVFFSTKHTPGCLEYVSCGFCQYRGNLEVIRAGEPAACARGTSRGNRQPLPFKILSKNPSRTGMVRENHGGRSFRESGEGVLPAGKHCYEVAQTLPTTGLRRGALMDFIHKELQYKTYVTI